MVEEYTDPEIMFERFETQVDYVIDGGIGGMNPSTVVDCATDDWQVVREGMGKFEG
jgi:tRNA A37 threonylcarbamoyladenosine synthetase subunit TsaC/SUA5/YrdC